MKIKTQIIKHGPTIMVAGGIGAIIAGTVLACRKTIKMKHVSDETRDVIEDTKAKLSTVNPEDTDYTEKDNKKEIRIIYAHTAIEATKIYALPAGIIAGGIAMILGGHNILRKRYATLSAAYVTLSSGFEAYRERVKNKYGEEEENKIYHNIETEEITEGKKKKKIDKMKDASMYDVILTPNTSEYIHGDAYYNHDTQEWEGYDSMLVKKAEAALEDRLHSKGMVFLNEAYKELGLEPTRAGQVVGWLDSPEDETRDSHINLDMYPTMDSDGDAALGIAFNVDGPILNYLTD